MKTVYVLLCGSLLLAACEQKAEVDNSIDEAFAKNSESVLKNIKDWEAETMDYSQYADNFILRGTGHGDSDSISLDDMKKMDKQIMEMYDFEVVSDSINLLPGVDAATRKMDGSVRHYINWKVTRPATDSTEAKSAVIKLYESFDFDENGKILYQQAYGDFGGMMEALEDDDEDEENE